MKKLSLALLVSAACLIGSVPVSAATPNLQAVGELEALTKGHSNLYSILESEAAKRPGGINEKYFASLRGGHAKIAEAVKAAKSCGSKDQIEKLLQEGIKDILAFMPEGEKKFLNMAMTYPHVNSNPQSKAQLLQDINDFIQKSSKVVDYTRKVTASCK